MKTTSIGIISIVVAVMAARGPLKAWTIARAEELAAERLAQQTVQ